MVPSPPSPSGSSTAPSPPVRRPSATARATSAAGIVPLKLSGATRTGASERIAERALGLLAVHGEDDALERRAAVLLRGADHDARGLVEREPADAGAERDQGERAAAELLRLRERRLGGAPDDVRGRRPAELHRRRVDDPAARHRAAGGLHRLAESDRRLLVRLLLNSGPARARDRDSHAAAVPQLSVGGVGEGVDVEVRHVGLHHLQSRHGPYPPGMLRQGRRCFAAVTAAAALVPPSFAPPVKLPGAAGGDEPRIAIGSDDRRYAIANDASD